MYYIKEKCTENVIDSLLYIIYTSMWKCFWSIIKGDVLADRSGLTVPKAKWKDELIYYMIAIK